MGDTGQQRANAELVASFWNEDTVELHNTQLRRELPDKKPSVPLMLQTVYGGRSAMIYLMFQILRSTDKLVLIRSVASAMASIHGEKINYTGSEMACIDLVGLDVVADDKVEDDAVLETNFDDASQVTVGEIRSYIDIDTDEVAAYFGVLCLAAVKRLTTENRTAFNELRTNAVRAQVIGELRIFKTGSPFLEDGVINKVYNTFNSMQAPRYYMFGRCASKMGTMQMGPPTAFAVMFMLLVDHGMGAIRIIKEAILKYPWIRTEFPELAPEMALANKAQATIKKAPTAERPFLKAIYGSGFVPMPYQQTANLTGVCRAAILSTATTYNNYRGGTITDAQEMRLNQLMNIRRPLDTTGPNDLNANA